MGPQHLDYDTRTVSIPIPRLNALWRARVGMFFEWLFGLALILVILALGALCLSALDQGKWWIFGARAMALIVMLSLLITWVTVDPKEIEKKEAKKAEKRREYPNMPEWHP